MGIKFTSDAEKERIEKRETRPSWEYLETTSLVEAVRTARDMGWKENKVQVRYVRDDEIITYFVEPYEKGCGCKGVLKYKEYFD